MGYIDNEASRKVYTVRRDTAKKILDLAREIVEKNKPEKPEIIDPVVAAEKQRQLIERHMAAEKAARERTAQRIKDSLKCL